jgi:hypothetical protein
MVDGWSTRFHIGPILGRPDATAALARVSGRSVEFTRKEERLDRASPCSALLALG